MGKRPTEEDLGIAETAEEQEIASRSLTTVEDDDLPHDTDDEQPLQQAAPETAEAKAARERDAAGKFVAKPKPDAPIADKPADGVRPEPVKPPPGFVDQRALQEARAQNKLLEERFNTLMEVVNKRNQQPVAEPQAPTIPDKNTDPLGYIDYIESRLGKIEGESAAQAKVREDSQREQYEFQQALTVAKPQYDEMAAADPTLEPTRAALFDSYANEIAVLNRTNPDYQRDPRGFLTNALTRLEQDHIKFAVASGQHVGSYMRDLARSRNVNAAPAQPQQAAPPAQQAPRTIAERQAAQNRHMSIGDLPGSAAPNTISAKDLVKMSPKQFAAYAKSVGEAGLDEIMGKA